MFLPFLQASHKAHSGPLGEIGKRDLSCCPEKEDHQFYNPARPRSKIDKAFFPLNTPEEVHYTSGKTDDTSLTLMQKAAFFVVGVCLLTT